ASSPRSTRRICHAGATTPCAWTKRGRPARRSTAVSRRRRRWGTRGYRRARPWCTRPGSCGRGSATPARRRRALLPPHHNLLEDLIERNPDVPLRVVRPHLGEIRDVADVIPFAVLVDVFVAHRLAGQPLDLRERLEDRARIGPAAA